MTSAFLLSERTVFSAQGSLNAAVIGTFERELNIWLEKTTARTLVIDFAEVDLLDSSTLVVLVNALKKSRQAGKCLMLSGVSPELKIIFELTQLDSVFALYPTPADAFASLETTVMAA